jgi:hypothetical protein
MEANFVPAAGVIQIATPGYKSFAAAGVFTNSKMRNHL